METDDSPASAAALMARAMNRALDAERAAQAAVAECEQEAANMLEQARQKRRAVLERAQARIVAIHSRAVGNLERLAAAVTGKSPPTSMLAADPDSNELRYARALARLAARLTTGTSEQPTDVP